MDREHVERSAGRCQVGLAVAVVAVVFLVLATALLAALVRVHS